MNLGTVLPGVLREAATELLQARLSQMLPKALPIAVQAAIR